MHRSLCTIKETSEFKYLGITVEETSRCSESNSKEEFDFEYPNFSKNREEQDKNGEDDPE